MAGAWPISSPSRPQWEFEQIRGIVKPLRKLNTHPPPKQNTHKKNNNEKKALPKVNRREGTGGLTAVSGQTIAVFRQSMSNLAGRNGGWRTQIFSECLCRQLVLSESIAQSLIFSTCTPLKLLPWPGCPPSRPSSLLMEDRFLKPKTYSSVLPQDVKTFGVPNKRTHLKYCYQ